MSRTEAIRTRQAGRAPFAWTALLAAVLLCAAPARAQLDQAQDASDFADGGGVLWQTFTPGVSGQLTSIRLHLETFCLVGCFADLPDMPVEIVTTSGGIPTATVLGSAVVPGRPPFGSPILEPVDLTSQGIDLVAGVQYAIRVTSEVSLAAWTWRIAETSNPYAGGQAFRDTDGSDGFDDPSSAPFPNGDFAFRTYMDEPYCGNGAEDAGEECDDGNTASGDGCSAECADEICGDGVPNAGEECEDGNTASGDGCSAACEDEFCGDGVTNDVDETCDDGNTVSNDGCSAACRMESCGDGVLQTDETCDDGNTVARDGCSAACKLDTTGIACRGALVKATQRYQAARLAALSQCRLALESGATLSVSDPAQCASETAAERKIAKAAARARKTVAGGSPPRCTDALVAMLETCADTVDAVISPDAASGCLRAASDAGVALTVSEMFGAD
jgi:cysteine-rich repeat protein